MSDAQSSGDWFRAWLHPAALFALLAVLGSAYAAVLLQRERIARLEARIEVIEKEYQRRDVVVSQLEGIAHRLAAIETAITARPR